MRLALLALALPAALCASSRVRVHGRQLLVDGRPFEVRGVCYSPVPINESVYFAPYGDYFTAEYSFIWRRDLPHIKAMGANTVRVYGWSEDADHSEFLDALSLHGLYLMATFYMGEATETPVSTQSQRDAIVNRFSDQVKKYKSHPSLLFWSFGNELNGVWNGFLTQLGTSPELDPCAWDPRYDDLGGCWLHIGPNPPNKSDPCYASSYCVYSRLFGFIDDAARAAKAQADVLVVSGMADVDALYDKVDRAGHVVPTIDAWTAQVYRGNTFGDFFDKMSGVSEKPVLMTEYGVDAFHDACGVDAATPCYNTANTPGSHEDGANQSAYAVNLTKEIRNVSTAKAKCAEAGRGDPRCIALGGFLMSWVDEYWKGAKAQAECKPTYGNAKCARRPRGTYDNRLIRAPSTWQVLAGDVHEEGTRDVRQLECVGS